MPEIRPITDLKDTTKIAELCHTTNKPVYITKNGSGNLVIMSMSAYDDMVSQIELFKALMQSENDIRNGRTHTIEEVFGELRQKYGTDQEIGDVAVNE